MATDAMATDTMATVASEVVPAASGGQEEEEQEEEEEQRRMVEGAQLYSPHKSLLVSPTAQSIKLGPTRYTGRQTTPPSCISGDSCTYIKFYVHML